MRLGPVSVYGLLIGLAVAVGILLCKRQEKRLGLPEDTAIDLALWAVPAAVIGARIYYVLFSWDMYRNDPISVLYIWEGGLAIYGGVIGGTVGIALLCRIKRLSFGKLLDMVAPSLILGQGIGRWGNYFNGEAYGYEVSNPVWQFFPACVCIDGTWHMATFFYESVWDITGFVLLYLHRKKVKHDGNLMVLYIIWYGIGRAFIEGLRMDSLYWGSVRVSQVLSIGAVILAGVYLFIRDRRIATHIECVSSAAGQPEEK